VGDGIVVEGEETDVSGDAEGAGTTGGVGGGVAAESEG